MRIGEVATRAGVSVRSLRYYEEQRLIAAARSASGQRHYAEGVVDQVRLIQSLYAAGLTSRTIASLMPCVHTGYASAEVLERLSFERQRVDRQVQDLAETRDRLDGIIARALSAECSSPQAEPQPLSA